MQWADVRGRPSRRKLRQFAGLWLVFFCGLAAWRAFRSEMDLRVAGMAIVGSTIGILGLISPHAIRLLYSAWMIAAFPIGWTMSRIMLGVLFFGVFTPVALIFRIIGRDALQRRRLGDRHSYWEPKPTSTTSAEYFRQF